MSKKHQIQQETNQKETNQSMWIVILILIAIACFMIIL